MTRNRAGVAAILMWGASIVFGLTTQVRLENDRPWILPFVSCLLCASSALMLGHIARRGVR